MYLIMMLNVEPVGGVSEPWSLVEVSQVPPQIGVINDTFFIALQRKDHNIISYITMDS